MGFNSNCPRFLYACWFAMVEVGFTQAKNASNIIMKNLMTVSVGTIVFWMAGFGIMFGTDINGLIGQVGVFTEGAYNHLGLEIPMLAFFIFQTVFCATSATIVSGAVAERTKYSAYILFSLVICLVYLSCCRSLDLGWRLVIQVRIP